MDPNEYDARDWVFLVASIVGMLIVLLVIVSLLTLNVNGAAFCTALLLGVGWYLARANARRRP